MIIPKRIQRAWIHSVAALEQATKLMWARACRLGRLLWPQEHPDPVVRTMTRCPGCGCRATPPLCQLCTEVLT